MDTKVIRAAVRLAAKVAPIYKGLDWKWVEIDRSPDEADIVKTLLELYDDIKDDPVATYTGTGGLYVGREDEGYSFVFEIREDMYDTEYNYIG